MHSTSQGKMTIFDFSIEKPFGIETIVNLLEKLKREKRIGCRNKKDP